MRDPRPDAYIPAIEESSYPPREGNLVRPLVDGEAAFTRICKAVEAAQSSVWVTVAYISRAFRMPGGRGSLFDVLDRAQTRGLDVRVIFWRAEPSVTSQFGGTPMDRDWLAARKSKFRIRWDRAQKDFCQHQKSWLIDAGKESESAFVGGINLNLESLSPAGHGDAQKTPVHDVYCELRGPAISDVHHNFVQRWNGVSERKEPGGVWPDGDTDVLPFPRQLSPTAGTSLVQIQRTLRQGQYEDSTAAPGAKSFDVSSGLHTIFDQYAAAIDAARETIYIEDQYLAAPEIFVRLRAALVRGVEAVFVCPADPEQQIKDSRSNPAAKPFYDLLADLGSFDNFQLAGLAAAREDGTLATIYVHAKIMLVDDCWCTIGSCNIANQSFYCDTELNAAIWDSDVTRELRCELLAEHLALDTSTMDSRAALRLFREIARDNAAKRTRGEPMSGLAFALDAARYGEDAG